MNHELLHEKALTKAKTFHRAEAELIDVLQEIDTAKSFLRYACTSLFDYCLKYLKLSEANASNFIAIARKSKVVPELKEAIRRQEITVSNARKITPVLTAQNSNHWLELAKNLPKQKLEKEVAKVAPQAATPELVKYVSEDRLAVRLGLSEKNLERLRRVQDLVSQKTRKPASLEDALEDLLVFYLQKKDPVEKAKRWTTAKVVNPAKESTALAAKQQPQSEGSNFESSRNALTGETPDAAAPVPGTDTKVQRALIRHSLPMKLKHQINLRDRGQCTQTKNGERCQNKRWLDVHHQIPLSKGGTNELKNLTTLCWAHHRMQH